MNPEWSAKKGLLGSNRKVSELPLGTPTAVDRLYSVAQPSPNPFEGAIMQGILIPAGKLGTPYPNLFGDGPLPFVVRYLQLSDGKCFLITTPNVNLFREWLESHPEKKKKVERAVAAVTESLF